MTTLFSPIGTADPITQRGDGPMLHLVRHYNPSKVVLFLSPAMAGYQDADERYTRAVKLLSSSLNRDVPEIELVESEWGEVYRFDHYIEEFEEVLSSILEGERNEPVLVNVSSGTPAMEQALVALGAFGRLNIKMLQVLTPSKGINKKHDREDPNDYDLDTLWELDEDRCKGAENRTIEVETPNFGDKLLRENVIALVNQYDYEAAFDIASRMRGLGAEAKEIIRAAAHRLNLEQQLPAKVFARSELSYKCNDLLAEYLSVMEVRLRQGHWAEFTRSLTPALTEIMKRKLAPYLSPHAYLQVKNGVPTDLYDFEKIQADGRLSRVLGKYRSVGSRYISNDALLGLIGEYGKDPDAIVKIKKLRTMEAKSRNVIAHTLTATSREKIEKEGNLGLDVVLQYLFDLHGEARSGLYDRINARIADLVFLPQEAH